MNERVKKYIPFAIQGITDTLANRNNEVDERYDGYAASLGPAIITSSLVPAIAFYTDIFRSSDSDNVSRFKLLNIITVILIQDGENISDPDHKNALLEHLMIEANNTTLLREKILDAIVALKLAFRNFKHV